MEKMEGGTDAGLMQLLERLEILRPRVGVTIDMVTCPDHAEVHHFLMRIMCFLFGLAAKPEALSRGCVPRINGDSVSLCFLPSGARTGHVTLPHRAL